MIMTCLVFIATILYSFANVNADSSWPEFDIIKAPFFSLITTVLHSSCVHVALPLLHLQSGISIGLFPPGAGTSTSLTRPCGHGEGTPLCVCIHSRPFLPARLCWPELRGYSSQTRPQVSILPPSYLFQFCPLTGCWAHIKPHSPEITISSFQPRRCLQMQHVLNMYMECQKISNFFFPLTEGYIFLILGTQTRILCTFLFISSHCWFSRV